MTGTYDRDADKAQFNIYLPRELIKRVKHKAVDEGSSLSLVVQRAIEGYLAQDGDPRG